jgi:type IV pilus assembly protein PilC
MAEFTYTARNNAGKQVNGTVVAQNESDALGELRRQNLVVVSLAEKAAKKAAWNIELFGGAGTKRRARARVKLQDMIVFTRQLATMLSAGIPLLECLEILAEQTEDAGFRGVIEQMVEDVRSGSDFSDALRKHPKVFSNIYVNMIKAGEASGQLDEILVRLAEYQEATAALRAKIRGAMTYPIVSLVLIFSITIFLLVFIIPKFQDIFSGMNIQLPKPTRLVLAVSHFMSTQWYIWMGGIVAFAVGITLYGRTPGGRRQLDWLKLRAPIFGPLFKKVSISRFARTFATLIQSGVPILGALEIVASTAGNKVIEDAVIEAATSVRQGDTLANPLSKSGVMPPMVCRMISIGEKSGALESLLEKISEFYDQQVSATVEQLTSLIEPIMIGIMGVVVGGMVLAIFLPIFELTKHVGR